jgi:DNA-binding XRE family transcriptional regulator
VAPHAIYNPASADVVNAWKYSAYVEGNVASADSPEFETIEEAINWALEQTDFVVAREVGTSPFWAGVGEIPAGISRRGGKPATEIDSADVPLIGVPNLWLNRARIERQMSVGELAKISGESEETILMLESGDVDEVGPFPIWLKLVCALTGRRMKSGAPIRYALRKDEFIAFALQVTELHDEDEDGKA